MGYVARPQLGGIDLARIASTIANVAGQVQSTANLVRGGAPAVSFATRYRWPLTIGISLAFGAAAAYLGTRQIRRDRKRR